MTVPMLMPNGPAAAVGLWNTSRGAVHAPVSACAAGAEGIAWAHFDTFAWRPAAKPGRPKGGDAMGLRAAFAMLKTRYPAP